MPKDMRWKALLGLLLIFSAVATVTIAQDESSTYLPVSFGADLFFTGTDEIEPNNSFGEANGALKSGLVYTALPNDTDDFFFFESVNFGDIIVEVLGLSALEATVSLYQETEGAPPTLLASTNTSPPDLQLETRGPAAKYYVVVHVSQPDPQGSNTPYTLQVNYVLPPTPTPVTIGTPRPTATLTPTTTPTPTRSGETPEPTFTPTPEE